MTAEQTNIDPSDYHGKIMYTKVDEAPALATYSFLPIVQAFTGATGVKVETRDISLAGRIIARFPDYLTEEQRIGDHLTELGQLAKTPEANIIKLPCISASIPQLKAAVKELQGKGYNLPDYPEDPSTDEERDVKSRYDRIKGSAVNPVLREGNSDRRAPGSVKNYARQNPYPVVDMPPDSQSHVAHMTSGDLRSNEVATTITNEQAGDARIEYVGHDGTIKVLKENFSLLEGEIVDATIMSRNALRTFLKDQVDDAREKGVLFSVHLKATMMKVSDPIIFGHVVSVFFSDVFEKHAETFAELGISPNNGLGDLYAKIGQLPDGKKAEIEADILSAIERGPELAMVNSDKGITNLHVPSDVIIDASMPAAIRNACRMWNREGKAQDTKFVIPDGSYAGVYWETVEFVKKHGSFDPRTMGTVQNVGLMAQKAEEYGSHDKTFLAPGNGVIRLVASSSGSSPSSSGEVLLERNVEEGDIWRACQVKDLPIQDWVKLAVNRSRTSGFPVVFWLNENRAHDRELLKKLHLYLKDHDTSGLAVHIMPPDEATRFSLKRVKEGKDTISATGNVLRDYLTDLFPILEVGTSARMLSIVPLMNGGGLFETGAGGSAPKHVQQFQQEGHLRWDSLGEFLALSESLIHLANMTDNPGARTLGETLDNANGKFLMNNRSPSRVVNEIDNRGSHFYLTLYWAEAMAEQATDPDLKAHFAQLAKDLGENEEAILGELMTAQGQSVTYDGYYLPNDELATQAMRPSATLNGIIDAFVNR